MMTRTIRRILLIATSLLLLPAAAHAHLTGTGLGPFYDGVTHFFLSPEQIIPGLALGLFAGLRGKRSGRIALFLLPAAWLIGGLIGTARPVTGQFTLLACFSFLVLGALVAFDAQLEARYVAGLSLCFGLALGYVNGSDFSTTNVGALGVLGSATSPFCACNAFLGPGSFPPCPVDANRRPRRRKLDCRSGSSPFRLDLSFNPQAVPIALFR